MFDLFPRLFVLMVFDLRGQIRSWSCKECEGVRNVLWGLPCHGRKGCILGTMDALNSKGAQHLLLNVVVYILELELADYLWLLMTLLQRSEGNSKWSSGGQEAIR